MDIVMKSNNILIFSDALNQLVFDWNTRCESATQANDIIGANVHYRPAPAHICDMYKMLLWINAT